MQGFETFCILFIWSLIHSIGIFFFAGRRCVDLVVTFNKGREEICAVSLQNRIKLCLHKIFGSTTKVTCLEYYFFILDVKCS